MLFLKGLKLICDTERHIQLSLCPKLWNDIFTPYKLTTALFFLLKFMKLPTKFFTGNYCLQEYKGFYMNDADQLFSMDTEQQTSRNWFNKAKGISIGCKAELLDYHGDNEKWGNISIIFQR